MCTHPCTCSATGRIRVLSRQLRRCWDSRSTTGQALASGPSPRPAAIMRHPFAAQEALGAITTTTDLLARFFSERMGDFNSPGNTFHVPGFELLAESLVASHPGVTKVGAAAYVLSSDRATFEAAAMRASTELTQGASLVPSFGACKGCMRIDDLMPHPRS